MKVGVALVDVITGLHATVGILAALQERTTSGRGQLVEVNLLSSLLSGIVNQSSGFVGAGFVPQIMGNRHPSIAPYESYPTADTPLVIAVGNDRQFRACAEVLGAPSWADDPRFATNPAGWSTGTTLYDGHVLTAVAAGAEEWFTRCPAVGVPAGPIHDLAGAFGLAERLGLEPVATVEGEPTVANPIRLGRTPVSYRTAPPALGNTALMLRVGRISGAPHEPDSSSVVPPPRRRRCWPSCGEPIVTGELRPGEQVLQDALAERFGVSRVPLREALKILEGEGQVIYRPHRGYFVAELDSTTSGGLPHSRPAGVRGCPGRGTAGHRR